MLQGGRHAESGRMALEAQELTQPGRGGETMKERQPGVQRHQRVAASSLLLPSDLAQPPPSLDS